VRKRSTTRRLKIIFQSLYTKGGGKKVQKQ